MAVILHAVSLAGVCRKGRSSPVPQVRARPEEMRCVGSKRTRELGRDMLLAASIVKSSVAKAHGRNRTVMPMDMPESAREFEIDLHGGPVCTLQSAHSTVSL